MSDQVLKIGKIGIGDLALHCGGVLRGAEIAYASRGELSQDRSNVVLVTHGFTSSHLFIGRAGPSASEGSWARLVGPGAAIDTDRFHVVSSNMLGSSYGSTAPASIDPATGRRYGPRFPALAMPDIVGAQHAMLEAMGITRLVAVVGPSYGGFQALAWGIEYPDFARGLSLSVSGLRPPAGITPDELRARFVADHNWNGGDYYETGGMVESMARLREETLRQYGVDVFLRPRFPEPAALDAEIVRQARQWAEEFDANSLIALAAAVQGYDAEPQLHRIRAKVQLVLSRTDTLFPPSTAPATMRAFRNAGVDAEYFALDSDFGHHAAGARLAEMGAGPATVHRRAAGQGLTLLVLKDRPERGSEPAAYCRSRR
ncbi:MAG: alpha/beta fold hydrolase [Acidisphaera sp.]|nr:alpha/beta fold hydrolase [Acidisphaera sp.]MBV9812418.1 alpha/beta fold hydrolase [Acetobacteraceae bacterium]